MKKIMLVAALMAAGQLHAQTTINSGIGIAGNGVTGTSPRYNIGMTSVEHFDGDRNPALYITINGKAWSILPFQAGSPYAAVHDWNAFQKQYVLIGIIKCTTPDGSQFLSGDIFINSKKLIVANFKALALYTPAKMTSVTIKSDILVRVFSPFTNTFVPRPDLTIYTPFVGGEIQLNSDYTVHGAIYDTSTGIVIQSDYISVIVPPPGGPGGHGTNGIYPLWLM